MFGPLNIGMDKEKAKQKAIEALELTELSAYAEENLMIWNSPSGNWLQLLLFWRWIRM